MQMRKTAAVHWMCALTALGHLMWCTLSVRGVCVLFRSKDGSTIGTKSCSLNSTISRVSQRLSMFVDACRKERVAGGRAQQYIEVECEPRTFEMAERLFSSRQLSEEIGTGDIIDILCLAEYLKIDNVAEKALFYRKLADATTTYDSNFFAEIEKHRYMHEVRIYVLQLLRKYIWMRDLVVLVKGNVATLSPAGNRQQQYINGSESGVRVVCKVVILRDAADAITPDDGYVIRWLLTSMGIKELDLSGCVLGENMIGIVRGIKSLERLDISRCKIEPGSLEHLSLRELSFMWSSLDRQGAAEILKLRDLARLDISCCKIEPGSLEDIWRLENLKELVAHGTGLDLKNMSGIGRVRSLARLDIRSSEVCPGGLEYIKGLKNLKELDYSYNKLSSNDALVIGGIESLRRLHAECCKIEDGSLRNMQGMSLEELDVHGTKLDKCNVSAIGKMRSLQRLDIHECDIRRGSLRKLAGLENLVELCASCNKLSADDMSGIGRMQRLALLDISFCKIGRGGMRHVRGLAKLQELNISHSRLGNDEMQEAEQIRGLVKLEARCCRITHEKRGFRELICPCI